MTSTRQNMININTFISRQRKARYLISTLSKLLLISISLSLLLISFIALTRALPVFYTVNKSTVTVAAGDTLWEIAESHMGDYPGGIRSYLAQIRRLNGLSQNESLAIGSTLVLPIYTYIFS